MPQPRPLHLAHDGVPCSKQSAPYVPLPAPGGWPRFGAASGMLPSGARGGLLEYGNRVGGGGGLLDGAWEIVHKKTIAEREAQAGRRSETPDPRVPADAQAAASSCGVPRRTRGPNVPRTRGP